MGACTFAVKGDTKKEVKRQIKARLKEAEHHGLYEDRRSEVEYDPGTKQYVAVLRVHT